MTETAWNTVTRQCPKHSVEGSRLLAEKVPGSVMRSGGLWHLILGLGLESVNEVGELDRILNKKDWGIVTYNVEVSLISVTNTVIAIS